MDENYEIAYKYFVNRDYENSKQQLERNINLYPDDVKNIPGCIKMGIRRAYNELDS